jgi:hypothetical protein
MSIYDNMDVSDLVQSVGTSDGGSDAAMAEYRKRKAARTSGSAPVAEVAELPNIPSPDVDFKSLANIPAPPEFSTKEAERAERHKPSLQNYAEKRAEAWKKSSVDNVESMNRLSGEIGAFFEAYNQADLNIDKGRLGYLVSEGMATPDDMKQLHDLNVKIRASVARSKNDPYIGKATGTIAPFLVESAEKGGKGALIGATVFGTGTAIASAMTPLPADDILMPITVPGAAMAGAKVGSMFTSVENMRQIEQGHAFLEMTESGVHPDIARMMARYYGLGSASLEMVQFKLLRKLIPGGDQLARNAMGRAVKSVLKNRAVAAGKNIGTVSVGEATVEGTQELTQNLLEMFAVELNDKLEGTNLSDQDKRDFMQKAFEGVPEVMGMTLVGMGITSIPGTTINFIIDSAGKIQAENKPIEETTPETEEVAEEVLPEPTPEDKLKEAIKKGKENAKKQIKKKQKKQSKPPKKDKPKKDEVEEEPDTTEEDTEDEALDLAGMKTDDEDEVKNLKTEDEELTEEEIVEQVGRDVAEEEGDKPPITKAPSWPDLTHAGVWVDGKIVDTVKIPTVKGAKGHNKQQRNAIKNAFMRLGKKYPDAELIFVDKNGNPHRREVVTTHKIGTEEELADPTPQAKFAKKNPVTGEMEDQPGPGSVHREVQGEAAKKAQEAADKKADQKSLKEMGLGRKLKKGSKARKRFDALMESVRGAARRMSKMNPSDFDDLISMATPDMIKEATQDKPTPDFSVGFYVKNALNEIRTRGQGSRGRAKPRTTQLKEDKIAATGEVAPEDDVEAQDFKQKNLLTEDPDEVRKQSSTEALSKMKDLDMENTDTTIQQIEEAMDDIGVPFDYSKPQEALDEVKNLEDKARADGDTESMTNYQRIRLLVKGTVLPTKEFSISALPEAERPAALEEAKKRREAQIAKAKEAGKVPVHKPRGETVKAEETKAPKPEKKSVIVGTEKTTKDTYFTSRKQAEKALAQRRKKNPKKYKGATIEVNTEKMKPRYAIALRETKTVKPDTTQRIEPVTPPEALQKVEVGMKEKGEAAVRKAGGLDPTRMHVQYDPEKTTLEGTAKANKAWTGKGNEARADKALAQRKKKDPAKYAHARVVGEGKYQQPVYKKDKDGNPVYDEFGKQTVETPGRFERYRIEVRVPHTGRVVPDVIEPTPEVPTRAVTVDEAIETIDNDRKRFDKELQTALEMVEGTPERAAKLERMARRVEKRQLEIEMMQKQNLTKKQKRKLKAAKAKAKAAKEALDFVLADDLFTAENQDQHQEILEEVIRQEGERRLEEQKALEEQRKIEAEAEANPVKAEFPDTAMAEAFQEAQAEQEEVEAELPMKLEDLTVEDVPLLTSDTIFRLQNNPKLKGEVKKAVLKRFEEIRDELAVPEKTPEQLAEDKKETQRLLEEINKKNAERKPRPAKGIGKQLKKGTAKGLLGTILNNETGELNIDLGATWEGAKKAARKMTKIAKKAGDLFDVEAPWKRLDAGDVGLAVKTMASIRTVYEDQAKQVALKITKRVRQTYPQAKGVEFRELMADVVLGAERQKTFESWDAAKQIKLGPAVKMLRTYFDDALEEYQVNGIDQINFYENKIRQMRAKMAKMKDINEMNDMVRKLAKLEELKFVHLPKEMWFPRTDAEIKRHSTKRQREFIKRRAGFDVLVQKLKRRAVSMHDLLKNEKVEKADLDPVTMLLNYGQQRGRDMSLVNIRDAAIKDGFIKEGKSRPKSVNTLKKEIVKANEKLLETKTKSARTRIENGIKKKEEQIQALLKIYGGDETITWDRVSSQEFGVFKGLWLDTRLINAFNNALAIDDEQSLYEQAVSITKMMQFYNPLFMPMYDLHQAGIMGGMALQPVKWTRNLVKAWKDVHTYTEEHATAGMWGAFSQPFSNPIGKIGQQAEMIQRSRFNSPTIDALYTFVEQVADDVLNIRPVKLAATMYNASWNTAWTLDAVVRQASYNYLRESGLSEKEAAQAAAKMHADYAGIPAKTRKTLNKVIFTPTFAASMVKVQTKMVEAALRTAMGFTPESQTDKRLAWGALVTASTLIGIDMTMRAWGYEPEKWGRTWVKEVDTPSGPKQIRVSLASPINKSLKYLQWLIDYTPFLGRENPRVGAGLAKLGKEISYEGTPLISTVARLFNNRQPDGQKIWYEFDNDVTKYGKSAKFLLKEIVGAFGIETPGSQFKREGEDTRAELVDNLEPLIKFFSDYGMTFFVSSRQGRDQQYARDIAQLTNEFKKEIKDAERRDLPIDMDAMTDEYLRRIDVLLEEYNNE